MTHIRKAQDAQAQTRRGFLGGLAAAAGTAAAVTVPAVSARAPLAHSDPKGAFGAVLTGATAAGLSVVYSNDCPAALKRVAADGVTIFQCDGTADEQEINSAINAVAATGQTSSNPPTGGGGATLLVGNNFYLSSPVLLQSWVDLGGVFGKTGTRINAASGFSGQALIRTAQTYTELTVTHDLYLKGTNNTTTNEDGLYYQGQNNTSPSPFTHVDPVNRAHSMEIDEAGGSAVHTAGGCRGMRFADIRCHAGQYGLRADSIADSQITDFMAFSCTIDGLLAKAYDTRFTNFSSWNCHRYGISIWNSDARCFLTACHSEDSEQHNYYIAANKVILTGCDADSAGWNSTSNAYDGFHFASGYSKINMIGCQSFDRNASPGNHQRYGVYLEGSLTYTRLQCATDNNVSGSFGGTTTPGTGSSYDVFGN